jgi:hypothetical protein
MAAYPLRIIHIVGIVAEWLVQYLKRTGTRFESQSGTTSQQPLPELCRNAADGAGGQTGTGRGAVNGQR